MKKILFIIFGVLLLAGCGNKEKSEEFVVDSSSNAKECVNYRNDYLKYLDKRLNLKEGDYIDDARVFYSEPFDLCVSTYELIIYGSDGAEYHEYAIDDVYKDEHLYWDSDFLSPDVPDDYEEGIKILREHKEHYDKWNNMIHKYRTGKTYYQERDDEIEKEL